MLFTLLKRTAALGTHHFYFRLFVRSLVRNINQHHLLQTLYIMSVGEGGLGVLWRESNCPFHGAKQHTDFTFASGFLFERHFSVPPIVFCISFGWLFYPQFQSNASEARRRHRGRGRNGLGSCLCNEQRPPLFGVCTADIVVIRSLTSSFPISFCFVQCCT